MTKQSIAYIKRRFKKYIYVYVYVYIYIQNFVSPEANHNQYKKQFNVIKKKQIFSLEKTNFIKSRKRIYF